MDEREPITVDELERAEGEELAPREAMSTLDPGAALGDPGVLLPPGGPPTPD